MSIVNKEESECGLENIWAAKREYIIVCFQSETRKGEMIGLSDYPVSINRNGFIRKFRMNEVPITTNK